MLANVYMCRNGVRGHADGNVPGMSAAYEKQALDKSAIRFEIITRTKKYPQLFTKMSLDKGDKNRLMW